MTGAAATAHPDKQPPRRDATPATCDAYSVKFHHHRARVLLGEAYDLKRWAVGPKRSAVRDYQRHRRCIEIAKIRAELADRRDRLADRLDDFAKLRAVTPYYCPGHGYWAVPCSIIECESHFSWSAYNPSGAAGPYQLMAEWGRPFPVTSEADKLAHHRIAARVWAGGAGRSNWVC